jgi:hypothetical protein
MLNTVDTDMVIPLAHHIHMKNLAKDCSTTTSHTQVDHLQVTFQKPNPEKKKIQYYYLHTLHTSPTWQTQP